MSDKPEWKYPIREDLVQWLCDNMVCTISIKTVNMTDDDGDHWIVLKTGDTTNVRRVRTEFFEDGLFKISAGYWGLVKVDRKGEEMIECLNKRREYEEKYETERVEYERLKKKFNE